MSKAQPSPPRIHTLLRMSTSAMASRFFASEELLFQHGAKRFDALPLLLISDSVFCERRSDREKLAPMAGASRVTSVSAKTFC
jgi:hypothetical protein